MSTKMRDVIVVKQAKFDAGSFYFGSVLKDGSLHKVIASLVTIRDSIPEECRASAWCEIGAGFDYDNPTANITIGYKRPATAKEIERDEMEAARIEERRLRQERKEYERLKEKFGG